MDNRNVEKAKHYHETTKLLCDRNPAVHRQSIPVRKVYVGGNLRPLEPSVTMPAVGTLEALARTDFDEETPMNTVRLSQILRATASLIARSHTTGEKPEVYLVSSDIPGLPAGVYHLDAGSFVLNSLRDGDYRPDLVAAAGDNQSLAAAPITLILSAALTRSYRTILIDTGRILSYVLVTASAAQLAASVEMSFVDAQVNGLLGLDGVSEAALCLIPLGRCLDWAEHVGERILPEVTVATKPRDLNGFLDPDAGKIHSASSLINNEETRPLRGPCPRPLRAHADDIHLDPSMKESRPLGEILQNKLNPDCTGKPMDAADLFTVLHHATLDLPADFLEGPETSLIDLYLVVHRISGIEAGLYTFHPDTRGLTRVRSGDSRVDLDRCLASSSSEGHECAAHLILVADLNPVMERFGNRGYRLAQVEAGATSGRIGLAAQSIGFGAPLLRFFDDAMNRFLSPYSDGREAIITVGLG